MMLGVDAGDGRFSTGVPLPCPLCGHSVVLIIPMEPSPALWRIGSRVVALLLHAVPLVIGYLLSELQRRLTTSGG
jgi:hypothetical protein